MTINNVQLFGRFVADPELKTTPSGTSVLKFTLAVTREKFKRDEENKTDFMSCVAWGKTAEFIAKYFSKGSAIYLEGSIQTGSFTDKNGVKHYTTDIVVRKAQFGENKPKSDTPAARGEDARPSESMAIGDLSDFEEVIGDDDVPF